MLQLFSLAGAVSTRTSGDVQIRKGKIMERLRSLTIWKVRQPYTMFERRITTVITLLEFLTASYYHRYYNYYIHEISENTTVTTVMKSQH